MAGRVRAAAARRQARAPALLTLAKDAHPYTRAFAVKGLGALKDRAALPALMPLLASADRAVVIEAIRALGRLGDPPAPALLTLMQSPKDRPARAPRSGWRSARRAARASTNLLLDLLSDPSPAIRAAALRSAGPRSTRKGLSLSCPGLIRIRIGACARRSRPCSGRCRPTWACRASGRCWATPDQRVIPAVLRIARQTPRAELPDRAAPTSEGQRSGGPGGRGLGNRRAQACGAVTPLADAYRFAQKDAMYTPRGGARRRLCRYGAAVATPVLNDPRSRTRTGRSAFARRCCSSRSIRPVPPSSTQIGPHRPRFRRTCIRRHGWWSRPSRPQVYIDTDRGTIQIELAVLDAPLTVENFIALARKGFFNGLSVHRVVPDFVIQDGDPRGDGEGGPGLFDSRRAQRAAVSARHRRHGARSVARHRRQPVLHHALTAAASRREVHRLRPRDRRDGGRRSDSAVGCHSPRAGVGRRADDGKQGWAMNWLI